MQMTHDAEELVINPIEEMIRKVKRISKNPLEAAQIEEQDALKFDEMKQTNKELYAMMKEKAKFETSLLESIIVKIGALLALGFGEAGSAIIAENMAAEGKINPMLEGKKTYAVFGFCDIHQFSEVTTILESDIMSFVNLVADIVHNCVDDYAGAPNKNIGDAFLLIWKLPLEELIVDNDKKVQNMKGGPKTQATIDMAIFAFIKIIAKINKSEKLEHYQHDERIKKELENYKLRMGFGLHIGWGIEGAIGSQYKIDASYLSPNVNMASRLEAATRQFGVTMLISGKIHTNCSEPYKKIMRHVDKVTVKGSIDPIDLFTVDLDQDLLEIEKEGLPPIIEET